VEALVKALVLGIDLGTGTWAPHVCEHRFGDEPFPSHIVKRSHGGHS
jgi:hypothetical protein